MYYVCYGFISNVELWEWFMEVNLNGGSNKGFMEEDIFIVLLGKFNSLKYMKFVLWIIIL